MKEINAFILAAGLGERLRPVTDHIPKPLLPLLGKPIVQHVLEKVSTLPFHRIGINLHHKKEDLEKWILQSGLREQIIPFTEKTILDTGGALKNAGGFLKEGTFLVHNADIISGIDLQALLDAHRMSGNLVTLAVHDCSKFNRLIIDEKGFLRDVRNARDGEKALAFTGIAVYEPAFLDFLPDGVSSVVDAWHGAVSAGEKIGTLDVTGAYWSDIGTPAAYAAAVFHALEQEGEVLYLHPSVRGCGDAELQRNVVIEEPCDIGNGLSMRNCIVLPGGSLPVNPDDAEPHGYENCIIGPGYVIALNEAEIIDFGADGRQLIGLGGSDRRYYRVSRSGGSAVLMECRRDDADFGRHIEYTHFFLKHGVPVPQLLEVDEGNLQALFEDAGDTSLYDYLKCPREQGSIEYLYQQVLAAVVQIHVTAAGDVSECPRLQDRFFDYEHFRWETSYFFEWFVEGIKGMKGGNSPELDEEMHRLALKADTFPKTIIHRDFQSQNIMVLNGRDVRIIDYQGARIGPSAYDIASLLWDPYFVVDNEMRDRLLAYYVSQREEADLTSTRSERTVFDELLFKDSLLPCRLQRHMQALGAYGFLSLNKGKEYFTKHIPEGLRLLREDIAEAQEEYPRLYRLITEL